jgi:hypothetical protein
MKKIFTLAIIALMSVVAFAQDVIVTKDKEQIQAKILEVSSDEIKYKKYSYLDGPTFSLDVDKVLTIAYENGDVEVYDKDFIEEKEEIIREKEELLLKQKAMYGTFDKEDGFYYLRGESSMTKMDKKAYLAFIQENCPEAYRSYQKGNTMFKTGAGMLGSGLGLMFLLGTPLYCVGLSGKSNHWEGCLISGSVFITLGSLSTAGSIPLMIVGGIKRNNSHEVYNEHCNNETPITFSVNATSNGIGLALNF